ncbi:uncharacterized protein LOC106475422 isoform X2 [Limulus polyphemus]|nr:uncharacterized protein LOC106475422 isoform X2 [Limulus polyphemus]
MAFYSPPDSLYQVPQQQAACPMVYGQPVYVPPQQYQYQPTMSPQWAASNPWRLTPTSSSVSGQFLYSAVPSVPTVTAATTTPASSEVYHYHAIPQYTHTLTSPAKPPGVQLSPYGEYVDTTVLENGCESSTF